MTYNPDINIQLWNVHFDSDEFSYTYLNQEKAIQSIAAFADLQISDDVGDKDAIIAKITKDVKTQIDAGSGESIMIVMIDDARVHIKRVIIDDHNPITRALIAAMPQVDGPTKQMITNLFAEPLSA